MPDDRDGAFGDDPIAWFLDAQQRAVATETFDVARAALATVSRAGQPSVRFVLVKLVDPRGFVFFTNYQSDKGRDLDDNPRAALAFHWHTIGVQARVRGAAQRIDAAESDAYFAMRPRISQLGAWASQQSRVVEHREALDAQLVDIEARFSGDAPVPRPPHWGGYRLVPEHIELWQDQHGRLHDRWLFTRAESRWLRTRLQP